MLAAFDVGFADAKATCEKMGYQVPSEENLARLKAEDPDSKAGKLVEDLRKESQGKLGPVHVQDKTLDVANGVVLCRKADEAQVSP